MGLDYGGLDIFDVSAQGFVDNGKGQMVPGNVLKRNKFDFQAFGARFKVQVKEMGPVHDIHLRDMGKTEEAKEGMDTDVRIGLFQGFPCGRFFGAFPQFHEPGREGPES